MYRMEEHPKVGSLAPDFALRDEHGDEIKLSSYRGRVNVLLAFYRGQSDTYSIKWLSQLKDDYLYFRGLDTEVLAVSPDIVDEALNTSTLHKIPFKLLSDSNAAVIDEYGVKGAFNYGAEASVFIIDKAGMVRYKYIGKVPQDIPTNEDLLKIIRKMA
jgi:peroxiredoxin Q/BCP